MGKIQLLHDRKDGSVIFPRTISQAVYHKGLPIATVLDSLDTRVTQNTTNIAELRDAHTWKRYIPSN